MATFRPRRARPAAARISSRPTRPARSQRAVHDGVRQGQRRDGMPGSALPPRGRLAAPSSAIAPNAWPASCSGTTSRPQVSGYRRCPTPRIPRCPISPVSSANSAPSSNARARAARSPAPGLAARAALALIRAYKFLISPWLTGACRFVPTCADYTAEAIARHGVVRGTWLGARRLAAAIRLGGHGHDPVRRLHRAGSSARRPLRARSTRAAAHVNGTSRSPRNLAVVPGAVRVPGVVRAARPPPDDQRERQRGSRGRGRRPVTAPRAIARQSAPRRTCRRAGAPPSSATTQRARDRRRDAESARRLHQSRRPRPSTGCSRTFATTTGEPLDLVPVDRRPSPLPFSLRVDDPAATTAAERVAVQRHRRRRARRSMRPARRTTLDLRRWRPPTGCGRARCSRSTRSPTSCWSASTVQQDGRSR